MQDYVELTTPIFREDGKCYEFDRIEVHYPNERDASGDSNRPTTLRGRFRVFSINDEGTWTYYQELAQTVTLDIVDLPEWSAIEAALRKTAIADATNPIGEGTVKEVPVKEEPE